MANLKVKDLMRRVNIMLASGEITPESEIIIGHYSKGYDGQKEDLYFWGVDYVYGGPSWNDKDIRLLEIQAYDEPLV